MHLQRSKHFAELAPHQRVHQPEDESPWLLDRRKERLVQSSGPVMFNSGHIPSSRSVIHYDGRNSTNVTTGATQRAPSGFLDMTGPVTLLRGSQEQNRARPSDALRCPRVVKEKSMRLQPIDQPT